MLLCCLLPPSLGFLVWGGGQSTSVICLHTTRRNSTTLLDRGEVGFQQPWSDLDLYPLVGTSITYTVEILSIISKSEREA